MQKVCICSFATGETPKFLIQSFLYFTLLYFVMSFEVPTGGEKSR